MNRLLSCAQARPASVIASVRILWREILNFLCPWREQCSYNLDFTPARPLRCGSHPSWTYTSVTVYLPCEETLAWNSHFFLPFARTRGSSNLGFHHTRPLTYGAHLTWTYTSGTVKHMTVWWYITSWPQNTICTNLRVSYAIFTNSGQL